MPLRLLLVAFTLNAVASQLLLRRAARVLPFPASIGAVPRFFAEAAASPWMYAALLLQIIGYALWILVVSREKLGVAAASVGSGFYALTALCAWWLYGETLSAMQWAGILLVTLGVVCITQAQL